MFTVPYDLTLFIFCDSTRRVELRGVPVKMPQFNMTQKRDPLAQIAVSPKAVA